MTHNGNIQRRMLLIITTRTIKSTLSLYRMNQKTGRVNSMLIHHFTTTMSSPSSLSFVYINPCFNNNNINNNNNPKRYFSTSIKRKRNTYNNANINNNANIYNMMKIQQQQQLVQYRRNFGSFTDFKPNTDSNSSISSNNNTEIIEQQQQQQSVNNGTVDPLKARLLDLQDNSKGNVAVPSVTDPISIPSIDNDSQISSSSAANENVPVEVQQSQNTTTPQVSIDYVDPFKAILFDLKKSNGLVPVEDSLSVKMLRLENQYSIMGPQQAVVEINSILNFWLNQIPSSKSESTFTANSHSQAIAVTHTKHPSVKEMMEWVERVQELSQGLVQPNVSTYQTILDAYIKTTGGSGIGNSKSPNIAEQLLEKMLQVVISSLPKSQNVQKQESEMTIQQHHEDVTAMTAQTDDDGTEAMSNMNVTLPPVASATASISKRIDSLEVTSVLYSYHKVMVLYGKDDNAIASEALLRKLEQVSLEYKILLLAPETYTIVLSNYSKNGKPREAEYVLYSMLNINDTIRTFTSTKLMPSKMNFDSCLNAWVKFATKVSGQRAELLVLKMLELSENGYDTKPNYKSYSKIVSAWANSRHEQAITRIDKVLETIERMDWSSEVDNPHAVETIAQTYLSAMRACSYGNGKFAIRKCLEFYTRLDTVLGGLQNIEYDTIQYMYAAMIYAWGQSALPETETKVQDLFVELDARHKKYIAEKEAESQQQPKDSNSDDSTVATASTDDYEPYISAHVYRAILTAFAKAGSGRKAEVVLRRMMQEYVNLIDKKLPAEITKARMVDTKCFNSVLLAWSRSKDPDAAHQAEKLFRQMVQSQHSKHMNVRLDTVSYNAVLSAMSGTKDVEVARRGDTYFRQILESNDPQCRPTTITYNEAMAIWSHIRTKEALDRVDELLNAMKSSSDRKIKPNEQTYKQYIEILKACSSVLESTEFKKRLHDMKQMIKKK